MGRESSGTGRVAGDRTGDGAGRSRPALGRAKPLRGALAARCAGDLGVGRPRGLYATGLPKMGACFAPPPRERRNVELRAMNAANRAAMSVDGCTTAPRPARRLARCRLRSASAGAPSFENHAGRCVTVGIIAFVLERIRNRGTGAALPQRELISSESREAGAWSRLASRWAWGAPTCVERTVLLGVSSGTTFHEKRASWTSVVHHGDRAGDRCAGVPLPACGHVRRRWGRREERTRRGAIRTETSTAGRSTACSWRLAGTGVAPRTAAWSSHASRASRCLSGVVVAFVGAYEGNLGWFKENFGFRCV